PAAHGPELYEPRNGRRRAGRRPVESGGRTATPASGRGVSRGVSSARQWPPRADGRGPRAAGVADDHGARGRRAAAVAERDRAVRAPAVERPELEHGAVRADRAVPDGPIRSE